MSISIIVLVESSEHNVAFSIIFNYLRIRFKKKHRYFHIYPNVDRLCLFLFHSKEFCVKRMWCKIDLNSYLLPLLLTVPTVKFPREQVKDHHKPAHSSISTFGVALNV